MGQHFVSCFHIALSKVTGRINGMKLTTKPPVRCWVRQRARQKPVSACHVRWFVAHLGFCPGRTDLLKASISTSFTVYLPRGTGNKASWPLFTAR